MAKRETAPDNAWGKAWGERITKLMADADLTPDDLADRMGINRSTAYHWRHGTRIPSRGLQSKLAKHLRTTVARLNGWAS